MIKKICSMVFIVFFVIHFNSTALSQIPYQVTFETGNVGDFVWSPDGSQFAYVALQNDTSRLFIIDADGKHKAQLTDTIAYGGIDWKGDVITFISTQGPDYNDELIMRISPDGNDEVTIVGPYWFDNAILRSDANWLLYEDGPNGWWQARRCDLNGGNNLILETNELVQQIGWFGQSQLLYGRGPNYNTTCAIHKINFDGSGHIQLTSANLPNNALFIGSPDTNKILYCDGSASSWDIWIMNADGSDPKQLTFDVAHDYLSNTRDNVWSLDQQSFYFVSDRSGNGDIYKMRIDGSNLIQMTTDEAIDFLPVPSPDGMKLAYLSQSENINNIWILNLATPFLNTIKDVPYDQGGYVTLSWRSSSLDSDGGSIPFYSIWRALPKGAAITPANNPNIKVTEDFAGTALRYTWENGNEYAWEWLANQPAHGFSFYSYTAATLFDSMSTTNAEHLFLISAHADNPDIFYDSNILKGYSVDNLAPLAPEGLKISQIQNTIELSWQRTNEEDLSFWVVYRNGIPIDSTKQALYNDINIEAGQNYTYELTAVDIHENESTLSKPASILVTGITENGLNVPQKYKLDQNYPNPFNPSTIIKYQLPVTSHVKITLYNSFGQEFLLLLSKKQEAGYYQVSWNASGLSSGIYYYKIQAGSFTNTKKMLFLK